MSVEQQLIPYQAVDSLGKGPVLVLAPHPDDEVFGCGGAILAHTSAGDEVRVVIATDGAFGAADELARESCRQLREGESVRAAELLGYGVPVFWRLPDRGLKYGEPLVERVTAAIRDTGAALIYAPSVFEIHPDHRALGLAAAEAVRRGNPESVLIQYEVAIPLRPNRLLDISRWAEQKHAAMRCFESQLHSQRYDEHLAALNRFRTYTLPREVTAAEGYFLVGAQELQKNPLSMYAAEDERRDISGSESGTRADPLVSVMIRSIDRPQLREALQSVALQTYPEIEVVVINAKGFAHSPVGGTAGRVPVRVVAADGPLSRSRAANLGLESVAGDYLIFLDDDDIFFPNHVAGLAAALLDNPAAVGAYAGIREETRYKDGAEGPVLIRNEPFNAPKLFAENYIPMHAMLFRRSALDGGLRLDESLEYYEDWDFWVQLALQGGFVHVDAVSACYRNSGACGFGLEPDRIQEARAKAAFFEKWRHRWSGEQLRDIIALLNDASVSDRLRDELDEAMRQLSLREAELAEIQASRAWRVVSACHRYLNRLPRLQALLRKWSPDGSRVTREISNS